MANVVSALEKDRLLWAIAPCGHEYRLADSELFYGGELTPRAEEFLAETVPGSNIERVATDPAFVSVRNYEVAHEYGVTPYIKPKDNAVLCSRPANAYQAHVLFATRFPERWRSVYRWRVKAECAIHSNKAAFGDVIRGRLR